VSEGITECRACACAVRRVRDVRDVRRGRDRRSQPRRHFASRCGSAPRPLGGASLPRITHVRTGRRLGRSERQRRPAGYSSRRRDRHSARSTARCKLYPMPQWHCTHDGLMQCSAARCAAAWDRAGSAAADCRGGGVVRQRGEARADTRRGVAECGHGVPTPRAARYRRGSARLPCKVQCALLSPRSARKAPVVCSAYPPSPSECARSRRASARRSRRRRTAASAQPV
jgi:hypothetical protein